MAETAFGTDLSWNSGDIGKMKTMSGGGITLNTFETSHMDSDTITNLAGLLKGEPITCTFEYEDTDAGNYGTLEAAAAARTAQTATWTFTDTSTISGSALVSNVTMPEGETESELTFSATFTPVTVWAHTGAA